MDVEKVVGMKREWEKQEECDEQAFHAPPQYLTPSGGQLVF